MGIIKLLPEHLINQIAAGEVVERPASVIKELIENAIDAESDRIVIETANGGAALMRVSDNGRGMDKDDAVAMFERHATSKIKNVDDLHNIQTMGFRGEAVASIASVAQVFLKTKQKNALSGTAVGCAGSKIEKVEDSGCAEGTQVEIKNLFFNTPARRKYLKTETTEYGHILNSVTNFALAFPKISFKLINNGRLIFDLPKSDELLARIQLLLGKDWSDNVLPVFYGGKEIKIEGFIGKPELARAGKSGQYLFINNREIKNNYINHAVTEAYHTVIPKGRYPAYILKLTIDPNLVDVNVHPRKLEVRFVNQQEIYSIVKRSTKAALEKVSLMPAFDSPKTMERVDSFRFSKSIEPRSANFSPSFERPSMQSVAAALNFTKDLAKTTAEFDFDRVMDKPKSGINPKTQIANSYIIAEDENGLVIIDQHAAHERIMQAALLDNLSKTEAVIQPLLLPLQLELSFKEVQVLEENKETLRKIGFEIESFGGNSFSIMAVPACLNGDDVIDILKGVIDDLLEQTPIKSVAEAQERVINFMACRSAIKFGRALDRIEQEALIAKLDEVEQKYTCPHGRPTMMKLTFKELEKRFGRS